VSTAFGCPYEGDVPTECVVDVAVALLELGCEEISIGDTIGVAHPEDVTRVVGALVERMPVERLALHLHDTYGRALENVDAGLDLGVRIFDSSAGGMGGCPYAPGAPGNVSTEAVCRHLDELGFEHAVDVDAVARAAAELRSSLVAAPRTVDA
jgi:hydroxymethylglutaryl-CoA lyase